MVLMIRINTNLYYSYSFVSFVNIRILVSYIYVTSYELCDMRYALFNRTLASPA